LSVAEKMETAERIVFATPVYWYAMSGELKVFFDRLTDLLTTHKSIGKALKGKKTYLIATGSDPELPEGFEVPFRSTSAYFDMSYEGALYKATR
jgi:multimeric flavodoxin WrbA